MGQPPFIQSLRSFDQPVSNSGCTINRAVGMKGDGIQRRDIQESRQSALGVAEIHPAL